MIAPLGEPQLSLREPGDHGSSMRSAQRVAASAEVGPDWQVRALPDCDRTLRGHEWSERASERI